MSESNSPVFFLRPDDPALHAAMTSARATFKYLWRELTWEYRRIIPGLQLSAVKAAFRDGDDEDGTEHMWLTDLEFNGEVIGAKLVNQPNHLRSVHAGDRVSLAPELIEDWMYVIGGRVYGGFTVQVLRSRMSPTERRKHDDAWGFDFGDSGDVAVVPAWDSKEKVGLLGRVFAKRPTAPPRSNPDAEHPMSENMASGLAEQIDKHRAAFLEDADADGLTTLHSLALGGSAAGVRVLLEKGADPMRRTRSGKTARDLAQQLGWPRVVALLLDAERRGQA